MSQKSIKVEFNQSEGHGSLKIEVGPANEMQSGDLFLWYSPVNKECEIHKFHSDSGYGIKTFTDFNEETGSSLVVNRSGVCGKIALN